MCAAIGLNAGQTKLSMLLQQRLEIIDIRHHVNGADVVKLGVLRCEGLDTAL